MISAGGIKSSEKSNERSGSGPRGGRKSKPGQFDFRNNQTMPLARGGKRPGAGRKPRVMPAQEESLSVEPTPSPAAVDTPGTALEGWALVMYLDRYLTGKAPQALGALAKQQGGAMVVDRIATFFKTAQAYTRGGSA